MKRFALFFGIAAWLVASCSVKEEGFKTTQQDDVIYYASFEQPAEEGTRVYANEDLLLRWTADDRVSIFGKITYNQQYKFLGETGDNSGGFSKVDGAEYVTGNPISHTVSVYPYQSSTKITEDEVLSLNLPSEQHYAENTFGLGDNTMVSVSEDNFLQYKNVGGYLVIKLYGEGVSVSSITLKGNNSEKLAGKATVTMPVDGDPSVEMASEATTEITLICETPVQLGANAEESTEFWFVVPPVTLDKGFTVSITKASGSVFEKSTSKSVTIERNHLSKMSPIEVEGGNPVTPSVPDAVDLGLSVKWASFNLGATKPEEYGDYYAWGETTMKSNYAWSTYKWCNGSEATLTKYCTDSYYGYNNFTDFKKVLDPEDDAAHVNLGGKWRMPTDDEWTELRENCTWTWTTQNGVRGRLVTGSNGNSIFLPAAGDRYNTVLYDAGSFGLYWSSSLGAGSLNRAGGVSFSSEYVFRDKLSRCLGQSVRPVYGEFITVENVSLNKTSFSLLEGSSEELTVTILPSNATEKTVTWTSNNPSVATVSDGEVTAVSEGTATITVWASDGVHSATCDVTVRESTVSVPEAIDMGLSVKWASFNLGASKPEEYGDYYAWGETEPYYSSLDPLTWKEGKEDGYAWASYKWCMGSENTLTNYCNKSSYGYNGFTDGKTVLEPEDDAAYASLGGNWRMPTDTEWQELRDNCTWTWATQNNVNGYLITASNGNSIFLPATGYRYKFNLSNVGSVGSYWSSSLFTSTPYYAWHVQFFSDYFRNSPQSRYYGFSIRSVSE